MKLARKISLGILVGLILGTLISYLYSSLYENRCKNRVFSNLQENITEDVMEANIGITLHLQQKADNVSSSSYESYGSGVIFRRDDDAAETTYYALTAYHVITGDASNATISPNGDHIEVSWEMIIQPYGEKTLKEANAEARDLGKHFSADDFYGNFDRAELVVYSEEQDIAVIRFASERAYGVLDICQSDVAKGEQIICIGNPEGEEFSVHYGRILSEDTKKFHTNDGTSDSQVIKHNAYVAPGSSGSAVLNEEMEIVGINIGGATNIFGKYCNGAMIPAEDLRELVNRLP